MSSLTTKLSKAKKRMRDKDRVHITWASMKVVTEIGAFISILLFISLIACIISLTRLIPNDICMRFNNGMLFLRSINDGYGMALRNMPPSVHSNATNLKHKISTKLITFYEFPFESVREKMTSQMVSKVFKIFAELPGIMYDVEDMMWYIDGIIRNEVFGPIAPSDYGAKSKRSFPFIITFNDTMSSDPLVNGDYESPANLFPDRYWRRLNDQSIDFVIYPEDYWLLSKVSTVQDKENIAVKHLKVVSTQSYSGKSNKSQRQPYEGSLTANELFVREIVPESTEQIFEIRIKKFADFYVGSDGTYERRTNTEWKSRFCHYLFNCPESMEGVTVFIKESDIIKGQSRMLHQLSHLKKKGSDEHKWTLQSFKIEKLYQSIELRSKVDSIDVVKWKKMNNENGEKCGDNSDWAKTKLEQEFEAPFIHRVILKYKQRDFSQYAWNQVLCAPYLKISSYALHLKFNGDRGSKQSDLIEARYWNVNMTEHKCEKSPNSDFAHLAIEELSIRSQTLGGNIDAKINVFFNKMETCEQWRKTYLRVVAKSEAGSAATKIKFGAYLEKELEETNNAIINLILKLLTFWKKK